MHITQKFYLSLEAMLEAQAEIFLRLPPSTRNKIIASNNQCDELISWEEEIYRKSRKNKTWKSGHPCLDLAKGSEKSVIKSQNLL